jgi:hypothetical protein
MKDFFDTLFLRQKVAIGFSLSNQLFQSFVCIFAQTQSDVISSFKLEGRLFQFLIPLRVILPKTTLFEDSVYAFWFSRAQGIRMVLAVYKGLNLSGGLRR